MTHADPTVALVLPTGDFAPVSAMLSVFGAIATASAAGVAIRIVNPRSSLVHQGRNDGVREALAVDPMPDFLWLVDSDMVVPPDALVRLMNRLRYLAKTDLPTVVGCTYRARRPPHHLTHQARVGISPPPEIANGDSLIQVDRLGMGCVLAPCAVFRMIAEPWFQAPAMPDGTILGEDYFFCDALRAAGVRILLDVGLSRDLAHLGEASLTMAP